MTKRDKKVRWFFRIRDAYVARSAILQVKRSSTPSVGRDGVERRWVVTLSAEVVTDPRYRNVWASDDEIASLLATLEEECGSLESVKAASAVPQVDATTMKEF